MMSAAGGEVIKDSVKGLFDAGLIVSADADMSPAILALMELVPALSGSPSAFLR